MNTDQKQGARTAQMDMGEQGLVFVVANTLGAGFLERFYERALVS